MHYYVGAWIGVCNSIDCIDSIRFWIIIIIFSLKSWFLWIMIHGDGVDSSLDFWSREGGGAMESALLPSFYCISCVVFTTLTKDLRNKLIAAMMGWWVLTQMVFLRNWDGVCTRCMYSNFIHTPSRNPLHTPVKKTKPINPWNFHRNQHTCAQNW